MMIHTRPMIAIKKIVPALCLLAVLAAAPVSAQENIPSLSIRPGDIQGNRMDHYRSTRAPRFDYQNDYLNETLRLQYQNVLLQKMILRQGTISRTEKSFMDVGVPFNQPPPPRGICEQLPANVPCYKAYPDLYPGIVPEVGEIAEEGSLPPDLASAQLSAAVQPPPSSDAAPPVETGPDLSAYGWAEVMCAGGQCSAVVTDGQIRKTVREGDVMGTDITIGKISAQGVNVVMNGKTLPLSASPAPSRGGLASPKYAGSSQQKKMPKMDGSLADKSHELESFFEQSAAEPDILPDMGALPVESDEGVGELAGETIPVATQPAAETPIEDPGPPLGPTGLY